MSALTTIQSADLISNSRTDINNNFSALNTDKVETSVIDTDTDLGGVSASDAKLATQKATRDFVVATASPVGKSWNEYAEANSGTDSYTISVPGVSSYVTGQTFKFKADVANTGACTLNVNGLGAKTIKKNVSTDLTTNDILANQDVIVVYDASGNMQIINGLPQQYINIFKSGTTTKNVSANTTTTIAHGLGIAPSRIRISAVLSNNVKDTNFSNFSRAECIISGGVTSYQFVTMFAGTATSTNGSAGLHGASFTLYSAATGGTDNHIVGTVSVDATNITITWSLTGSPAGTAEILWEVQY